MNFPIDNNFNILAFSFESFWQCYCQNPFFFFSPMCSDWLGLKDGRKGKDISKYCQEYCKTWSINFQIPSFPKVDKSFIEYTQKIKGRPFFGSASISWFKIVTGFWLSYRVFLRVLPKTFFHTHKFWGLIISHLRCYHFSKMISKIQKSSGLSLWPICPRTQINIIYLCTGPLIYPIILS